MIKYKLYRPFMRFIHKYGFHYAPAKIPPEPSKYSEGLPGMSVTEWNHWCHWCGLRGNTLEIEYDKA